jgi:hypothetical protein
MRSIINFAFLLAGATFLFVGCEKVAELPNYKLGHPVTLTPSATSLTPGVADSSKNVLTLNWTFPQYATDSANMKYIVEIDSTGRGFAKEVTFTQAKTLSKAFTGRDLNTILLNYGSTVGTPVKLDMRVTSSYSNNNEKYLSNVVQVTITPYSDPSKLTTENTSVAGTSGTSSEHSNTFSWSKSFPGYAGTVTYIIQYDSAGKNFASPQTIAGYGGTSIYSAALNQGDMNTTALTSGIAVGSTGTVEYRVKATTASGSIAYSNAVTVDVTTFSPVPANLYIVGDATPGGWNNPVPLPSQQFTKVDDYRFSIRLGLTGGKSYLFLPVNGDWGHKYGGVGANNTNNPDGDDFKPEGGDLRAPASSGVYDIVVDFQTNKFTVTPVSVPTNLYIVGDATAGGWNNPVPVPSQQFTKIDAYTFAIVINLTAGKSYLFLPVNGDWSHKYGGSTDGNSAATLLADGAVPGSNTPAPGADGQYLIVVNFATNTYRVVLYSGNLYMVGDATPGGWNNPVPLPSQQLTETSLGVFELNLALTADKSFLFLPVNGDWGHKFGGVGANNTNNVTGDLIRPEGGDLKAPAASGNYKITVNFINMSYKIE